jgi:hypothetical protein
MDSITKTELQSRYDRLTTQIADLLKKRTNLVHELTTKYSGDHDGIDGSFSIGTLKEIDATHPLARSANSEKIRFMNEVVARVETDDEYQRLTAEIDCISDELDGVWALAADVIVDPDQTKKENIRRLWTVFGEEAPNPRIAEAVGCHSQYPMRLTYDPETETVDYKEHVKQRKNNQVPPDLRQEILKRDKRACDRCGTKNNEAKLKIHHIDPVNDDGPANPENLATLCPDCHDIVHDHSSTGRVIYSSAVGFWQWVLDGSRGFNPHQRRLTDF